MKIHPGSVMCDKKVPAIMYDELVRVCSKASRTDMLTVSAQYQVYTTHIYARGVSSIPKAFVAEVAVHNRGLRSTSS